jgi:hypothetical protein
MMAMSSQAMAGSTENWVTYTEETGARLVAPAALSTSDFEEKDYAWGDVDQDGDLDLVVVRKQPFTSAGRRVNVFFMNEGIDDGHAVDGVLVERTEQYVTSSDVDGDQGFNTPTNDRDVVLVDLTGDGWLDIITATTLSDGQPKHIGHPRVYRNLGDGGDGVWDGFIHEDFRIPQLVTSAGLSVNPRFCSVDAVDVDDDGDMDLYFGDYDSSGFFGKGQPSGFDFNDRLLINDGTGVFTDESTLRMTFGMLNSAFSAAIAHGDMNGDGAVDIVKQTALMAPQYAAIIYNNPGEMGVFNGLWTTTAGNLQPYHINVGDLNNDDRLDFVVADDFADSYFLNQGNDVSGQATFVKFTYQIEFGSDDGFASNNMVVDLDEDGWHDVIIADVDVDIFSTGDNCSGSRRMHIYRNMGNAPNVTLRELAQQPGSSGWKGAPGLLIPDLDGVHDFAPIDLDGDGSKDLIIGRCDGMGIYMGDAPLAGSNAGDCDGDGDVDLVDFASFQLCFTGPGGVATAECGCSDTDDDDDVDLVDFANFQLLFTGPM